jgi:ketosteroid isomerase-like protein
MSRDQNVEVIRGVYDAFTRGDVPAVLGLMTPAAEWTEAEGFPYAGTYKGPDAILQGVLMKLGTEWDGFRAVPDEFVAQGDRVVAIGEYSGRYKATGKSFRAPFVHVWTVRDGRIERFVQHTDTALVQRALNP